MDAKKVLLIILDGWGLGTVPIADAVNLADTPFFDKVHKEYPSTTLVTFGNEVGLPDGQMGNSEVGHLNIGGGRIVYQDLLKIDNAISDGLLPKNEALQNAIAYAKKNGKAIHLLGLLSDGGVHSQIRHLKALCDIFDENQTQTYIHAFTDGRDTDPKGGEAYLTDLEEYLKGMEKVEVASICGRYYAMDRDERWERIKLAYDLLTKGEGQKATNLVEAIKKSYEDGVTDEFIKPIVKVKGGDNDDGEPLTQIQEGDVVMCFNFRTDRCRQITRALHQENFEEHGMQKMDLHYVTMTEYNKNFKGIDILFKDENLKNTLGEVLEANKKTQLRAAETEKYPHVTFFFSGGREDAFKGEERIIAPSPKVATYDLQPEMSANELTEKVREALQNKKPDFAVINYANPDMVGHTGVMEAVQIAVETADKCAKQLVEIALENDYSIIIIADHGNADFMINDDGTPNTAHTKNLVPMILIDSDYRPKLKKGKLGDIAPSILHLMNIDSPKEMTGNVLFE